MKETNFKDTELGLIPFDWDVVKLKTFLTLLTDYDANGSFQDMAQNVNSFLGRGYAWYVRATDLEQHSKMSEVRYVDEKSYKFLRKSSLYGGEVLLAKRGEIGKVYYFKMQTQFATLAPNLYLLKLNDKVDSKWLYYLFTSQKGQDLLKSINASTSLGAIYKEDVKNLNVYYLPIKEQSRIATALSDIDSLIQKTEELLEKKRNIKQGAMQQLLTGKKRLKGFTGEWRKTRLQNLCKILYGYLFTPELYDSNGVYKVITISNVQDGIFNSIGCNKISKIPSAVSPFQWLSIGDLLISMTGNVGRVCIVSEKNCLMNYRVGKFEPYKDILKQFLFQLLRLPKIQNEIILKAKGGSQPNISENDVLEMEVLIPVDIKEQEAISTILLDMDKEIDEVEQKLVKLRDIKQGMMQQLLTGKIRLV